MIKELTQITTEYNSLVTHPLQSWEWGEFRKSQGHNVVRFGQFRGNKAPSSLRSGYLLPSLRQERNPSEAERSSHSSPPEAGFSAKGDKLISAGQMTFHRLLKTPFSVGYFPKGPMPDKEIVNFLKTIGQKNKAIFIKMEPNVTIENCKSKIENLGLVPGKPLFTKYTSVIDLTKTEDEFLKDFKPKTRYNIHLAEEHGVKVQEDNSEKAFENYLKLLFETTKRQGFFAHDENFHRQQWKILRPAGISHLLTAIYGEKTLSSFLLFVFNNVLYYPYGASTREHKELMAPTLLMWEAIKFGKKMGCQSLDLWGDIEPNPAPNHPYFGFHRFKEGFSPKLIEFTGTYDLIINPRLYKIYNLVDKLRWKILRLKKKLF